MPTYRGTIVTFDDATYRAAVRLDGSAPQRLANVHCNRLTAAAFATGRRCLVDTGDHGDIDDAVVLAVWEEGAADGAAANVLYAYDAAGGETLTVTADVLNLDTAVVTGSRYALAADVVTFQQAGTYRVTAEAVVELTDTAGTSDAQVELYVEKDTGSGFAAINDAIATQHKQEAASGGCSLSLSFVHVFAQNDDIRVMVRRASGGTNIQTQQYGGRLLIEHLLD